MVASPIALVLLFSCVGEPPPPGEPASSNVARNTSPDVDSATLQSLTASNRAFALDLYGELADSDENNLFISPHSISLAFVMTYAGAEGETATQMSDVLRFDLPEPELHEAFNALDLELATRSDVDDRKSQGFELSILNQLFGETDLGFEPGFLDTLALNYGAGMRLLDFRVDPEGSRREINDWVLDATRNRIEDLLPAGSITPLTRLVLTNAIYFKAEWGEQFEVSETRDEDFGLLDGSTVSVSTMHGMMSGTFASGDGWALGELPYLGNDVVMGVLVPEAGRFDEIEGNLDAEFLDAAIGQLEPAGLQVALPKLTVETEARLKAPLEALGMPLPFSDVADFSGITGETALFISDAFHKTFVKVDEEGTEAAAATAVVARALSAGPPPAELIVDRPFVFWIRDRPTGAMLFLGRITDPR